jgi:hypothetical protein
MKDDKAPMFGEYVKLSKTGEIAKWKSYDPKTEMVQIESPAGLFKLVHRQDICRLTAEEELEFLRHKKTH